MAGAGYCVKTAADIITGDGTIRANVGDVVANVTTDENGFAKVEGLFLGNYIVYETKAPQGFIGLTAAGSQYSDTLKITLRNTPTILEVAKADLTTGTELPGATLTVIDDDGIVTEWITDGRVHRVIGLEPGNYTLREISAPSGYEIAEEVAFTVKATGEIQNVKMEDSATRTPPESSDLPKTGDNLPWWIFALISGGLASSAGSLVLSRILGARVTSPDDVKGKKC